MSGIMIVGTASSSGKSLTCTALCRIFYKDGFKVTPFKSQNMSLNSFVTMEGLEMGRAQVLQAIAAGVQPSVVMNPILLKPTSDRKSQVIIKGKPYRNMDAAEYYKFKPELKSMIGDIYKELEEKCDVMVIEGAGSPVEINLMDNDFVNMGMAEIADAAVLLVADIDRGGVFAAIYGTIMLMGENDRKRVKGIIINKFRGDRSILKPGLDMIEELVKIPIVGVIPYMNIKLDEEDGATDFNINGSGDIDVCVIKIPRISNFTDFDGFKFDEDVNVRYITSIEEIGNADILIIPGSKNTIEDLRFLKRQGFEKVIKDFSGMVFGICGGYQMLGNEIIDEEGWEVGAGECEKGIGIFNTITVFKGDKITTNVEGTALGHSIYGYEIHSGKTTGNSSPFVNINICKGEKVDYNDGEHIDNKYFGTYIHGIFDSNEFRQYILNIIRRGKKLTEKESLDLRENREGELAKLEKITRENIDMKYIYSLIGR